MKNGKRRLTKKGDGVIFTECSTAMALPSRRHVRSRFISGVGGTSLMKQELSTLNHAQDQDKKLHANKDDFRCRPRPKTANSRDASERAWVLGSFTLNGVAYYIADRNCTC